MIFFIFYAARLSMRNIFSLEIYFLKNDFDIIVIYCIYITKDSIEI